jgi:D-alanine--poly(phosphoribitol) ligase subunit 2
MTTKNAIIEIIFKSIDEINQENETHIAKDVNTRLFGKESELDSLGLVNLITSIEEGIEELTGNYIPIADERAFSLESSPFKTIETLASYIEILLND